MTQVHSEKVSRPSRETRQFPLDAYSTTDPKRR